MSEPIARYSSKLLAAGFVHGFFTRIGGTSSFGYATLNGSYSVGDDPNSVTTNLARIAGKLGIEPDHLVTVSQVHGSVAERFDEDCSVSVFGKREADAVMGRCGAYGLAVRTADCVPILVGCTKTGSAAAIHAGWRGLVAGIVKTTLEGMVQLGCTPDSLVACIGPHIRQLAFEVSEEVAAKLEAIAPKVPAIRREGSAKPHVALGLLAAAQLEGYGIPSTAIEDLEICTYSNEQDFFSFRRDGNSSGRQISVIRPRV